MPFSQFDLQRLADSTLQKAIKEQAPAVRRKCFISYHHADSDEVAKFIQDFGDVFIAKVIGISDDDPLIDSTDADYVFDQIREKYLTDSTVTIVLIGECTWGRRYVDWEIASTLRNDPNNRRSGLMAVTLPSMATKTKRLPDRLADNLIGDNNKDGYARWYKYPTTDEQMRTCIETAFEARTSLASLIVNNRPRRERSAACP